MSIRIKILLRLFIFWLILFACTRLLFILYYNDQINEPLTEVLGIFYHSIPLDVSACCYLISISLILLVISFYFNPPWLYRVFKIYNQLMLLVMLLITSAELCIYSEWGTKLHFKGLMHLAHPDEVFRSATWLQTFVFVLSCGIQFWFFNRVLSNYIMPFFPKEKLKGFKGLVSLIVGAALIVIGIRGGLQQIPINQSSAYYSASNILNLAAVNSAWNLVFSIHQNFKVSQQNPYNILEKGEAEKLVQQMHPAADSIEYILNNKKPNIVLIILESWSSDLIPSCGGDKGATQNFEKLVSEGLLFSNVYASGDRSEQGMAAIFSGFPAQPLTSVIKQPDKFQKLPSLGRKLKDAGYSTSFYFGGQLSYGNIKSYMVYNGIENIIDLENLEETYEEGKLGVHDGDMLKKHVKDIGTQKQPFFSSLFTLSTHSPFDMPLKKFPINWGKNENAYVNSIYYADSCLGAYFEQAKKEPWYKNTLFVLVSDHSRNSHRNWEFISPEYHRIPLLFYGDVLKEEQKGRNIKKMISQTDLVSTLLPQLDIDSKDFKWSRNQLGSNIPEYAYYSFINGLGWVTPDGYYTYDYDLKKYYHQTLPDSLRAAEIKKGNAYLQVMFQEYLDF